MILYTLSMAKWLTHALSRKGDVPLLHLPSAAEVPRW